jgi:hypothetical protein
VASSTEPTPASIGLRNTTWRYSPSRFEGQAASRGLTLFLSHTPVAVARRQPEARDRVAVRRPRSRGSRRRQGPNRGLRLCGYSSALPEQCVDLNIVRRPARLDPDQRPASKDAAGQNTPAHDSRDYVLRDPDRSKTRANPAGERRQRGIGLLDASSANTFVGFDRGAITPSLPPAAVQDPRPLLGVRGSKNSRRSPDRRNHRRTTYQLWRPVIVCGQIADAPGCDGVARAFGHKRFWALAALKSQPSILTKDPLRPHDTLTTLPP